MGLHWFRQRIDMDKNYRGKRSLSAEQSAKPSMKVTERQQLPHGGLISLLRRSDYGFY